jgi:hypothetical protein
VSGSSSIEGAIVALNIMAPVSCIGDRTAAIRTISSGLLAEPHIGKGLHFELLVSGRTGEMLG